MPTSTEARFPIPWGLIGLIGLVLAVESIVARHELGLMTYVALNARYAAAEARTSGDCRVLCLGDSQVKFGLDPRTIEAGSGFRARNLAIAGSPTTASYLLLRRALDAGARPSAVLVGHMTLSIDLRKQAPILSAFDRLGESLDLAWSGRDAGYFASAMLARVFPSIRERDQIRATLRPALDDRAGPSRSPGPALLRTWEANRGADLQPLSAAFAGRMEPALEKSVYSQPWMVHPVAAQAFRRLLDLAASRGITVFWLLAPITPEAAAVRNAHGLTAHQTRNVRALQSGHPNLIVLDGRHSGCPASAFLDSCHLNERGALWISDAVAAVLRGHREGRSIGVRWIDLPPYSEPSGALLARTRGRAVEPDSPRSR